jgi:hypothetical protein
MSYGIKAVGFANGYGGQGHGVFTDDPTKAMRFDRASDAMMFWGTQSTVMPTRPDGRPNKPLTALTAAIEPLP